MWLRIPEERPDVVAAVRFCVPSVRSWRDDPWACPPIVLYRAAEDGDRMQLALHYTWTRPSLLSLKEMHPTWSQERRARSDSRLRLHERKWGPGDLELVVLTLVGGVISSIEIRLRLGIRDVLSRPLDFLRRLAKRQSLERRRSYPAEVFAPGRPILIAAPSEHHEWTEPNPLVIDAAIPWIEALTAKLWDQYEIESGGGAGRASLEWERQSLTGDAGRP